MQKLNFSGNLPITIRNNIVPVISAGAFSIIQDNVQDGRLYVKTAISRLVINITLLFYLHVHLLSLGLQ